jgi:hypothetical protein
VAREEDRLAGYDIYSGERMATFAAPLDGDEDTDRPVRLVEGLVREDGTAVVQWLRDDYHTAIISGDGDSAQLAARPRIRGDRPLYTITPHHSIDLEGRIYAQPLDIEPVAQLTGRSVRYTACWSDQTTWLSGHERRDVCRLTGAAVICTEPLDQPTATPLSTSCSPERLGTYVQTQTSPGANLAYTYLTCDNAGCRNEVIAMPDNVFAPVFADVGDRTLLIGHQGLGRHQQTRLWVGSRDRLPRTVGRRLGRLPGRLVQAYGLAGTIAIVELSAPEQGRLFAAFDANGEPVPIHVDQD